MITVTAYEWAGRDRSGKARSGSSDWANLAQSVQNMYMLGWQSLTVMPAGSPDRVAAIEVQGGKRVWWATVPARADR